MTEPSQPAEPTQSTAPTAPSAPLPGGNPEDLAGLSYEQARAALDKVVSELESSTVNLEMSLALWERGTALADICQAHLDGARERIEAARPGLSAQIKE
jgi:exodeoxyribonuclease VII small subunit